jgi:hypothetical protein
VVAWIASGSIESIESNQTRLARRKKEVPSLGGRTGREGRERERERERKRETNCIIS